MVLSGKYTVIDEDNFQNYIKAVGFNGQYLKYTIEFHQDGDKVKINEFYGEKSPSEVIIGGEVEEMSITGSKVKAMEYHKPAYQCVIDLMKAFDRIQVEDVLHLLYKKNIPINIIQTIENIYFHNRIQAKINEKLTPCISVQTYGVRQGDSLSPLFFNIIMDEIIKKNT
ncbi:unnamed protein product [Diabrotica balteata]|uniref:Reverse transcriptase domain-containing protein n=1 Tax=Diabrotica balteata TaxID=107213 RepID=A0A9N9SU16_DIABA|nr:unnamed protein product [Diabrotica balteata]